MLFDPYRIAKIGLAAAGTTLGVQVSTDKPPPELVVNEYGQEEYFQDASMLEHSITRATKVIEQIDAKIVARFFYAAQKKGFEVSKEHSAMVQSDPELSAMWDLDTNEAGGVSLEEIDRAKSEIPMIYSNTFSAPTD